MILCICTHCKQIFITGGLRAELPGNFFASTPSRLAEKRGNASGVTEQCGTFNQCGGLGPLSFCKLRIIKKYLYPIKNSTNFLGAP